MALILPVCLTWGPLHKSIKGPHLTRIQRGHSSSFQRTPIKLEPSLNPKGRSNEGLLSGVPVDCSGGGADFLIQDAALELVVLKEANVSS